MKFLPEVATTTVLIFLCVTIKEGECENVTATPHVVVAEVQEPSFENNNTTMTTGSQLHGPSSPVPEMTSQQNATSSSPAPEMIIQKQNSTVVDKKQQRTCACDDSEESNICASNGVTYKSPCRFECAKAKVARLRQVKQGRCSQAAGAGSYWQSKSG